MSLTEVSKATRIQVKYLELLESGNYEALPADVYVRGFLRSYARHLNVDEQILLHLYERERNIQKNLGREIPVNNMATDFSRGPVVITSRTLVVGLIALLLLGSFAYLYREFRSFGSEPLLIVLAPDNGSVVSKNEVLVVGKTDRGATMTMNGQAVFVDADGGFQEKLMLQPGMNGVTLRTVNRFQKEKVAMLSLEARYTIEPIEEATLLVTPVKITISARETAVTLSVLADGIPLFEGVLAPNETRVFEAKASLVVSSDKGEATYVTTDGGIETPLGSVHGRASDVVFENEKSPPPSTP